MSYMLSAILIMLSAILIAAALTLGAFLIWAMCRIAAKPTPKPEE